MATNYGRGRENPGKVHIIDPVTYTKKTIVGGSCLCSFSSCVRMVKADTPESLSVVDCKRCLKMWEKRTADRGQS